MSSTKHHDSTFQHNTLHFHHERQPRPQTDCTTDSVCLMFNERSKDLSTFGLQLPQMAHKSRTHCSVHNTPTHSRISPTCVPVTSSTKFSTDRRKFRKLPQPATMINNQQNNRTHNQQQTQRSTPIQSYSNHNRQRLLYHYRQVQIAAVSYPSPDD